MQTRDELESLVAAALRAAIDDGELALDEVPDVALERPRDVSNGDWASTVALRAAKQAKRSPREVAQRIAEHLPESGLVERVEVAGPGFVNFTLADAAFQQVVAQVRGQRDRYASGTLPEPCRVNIEYISANPTGPFHVGHGRWAALGDATARVMRHAGYDVYEEFYINDHGVQMDNFADSVAVRYQQLLGRDVPMPESCYAGAYVADIARAIIDEDGDAWLDADPEERRVNFRERAYAFELAEQHRVCDKFGTTFDRWFSERDLYVPDAEGRSAVDRALAAMDERGYLFEQDGALWFRSTGFGDDKDRVLRKGNGEYTYFTSDMAYHYDKMTRGFDHLIDIWGADHHGYIKRCEAMLEAWGWPGVLEVMLGQLVNLFRNGEQVRMSKRTGEMVTFEELIDEVGVDATRWLMLSRSADQVIDFDIEEAKQRDASNPVYYVQYAHARICSILRKAAGGEGELSADEAARMLALDDADLSLLSSVPEIAVLRKIDSLEDAVAVAARDRAAFRMTHFAQETATLFTAFYTNCRVIGEEQELQRARLALCDCTRIVLRLVLGLLGISAPERM